MVPERISDADLKLHARALRTIEQLQVQAQAVQGFVSAHFADAYGLQPGDRIEDDGTIVRQERASNGQVADLSEVPA